jgi:predicted phosphohydrolase
MQLYEAVRAAGSDAVLLGGDIGEAATLTEFLEELSSAVKQPVYFVLGNHDFYGGAIAAVREAVCALRPALTWLPAAGVVPLSDRTALVGNDGWADARLGDFFNSPIVLNDYVQIRELAACGLQKDCLVRELNRLGDEAANAIEPLLREACSRFESIILLTHVPPFREACWYEGHLSNGDWLPHFTCKAMGDAILRVMAEQATRRLIVLCGHTHGAGIAQIDRNILVKTGGATYGSPQVQEVMDVY